jgi:hypothetical protein
MKLNPDFYYNNPWFNGKVPEGLVYFTAPANPSPK